MRRAHAHGLESEWGPDFTRGVGLSAILHLAAAVLALWVASLRPSSAPLLTAYTVELTDPAALGGRLAFGPLDRPLGRPRRIADAAGGAPAGAPSPGESPAAEAAKPQRGSESPSPVAQAKVAQAPKAVESAKPDEAASPAPVPTPVAAEAKREAPKPAQPPPSDVATPVAPAAAPAKPPVPEVRLAEKPKPSEQLKRPEPSADAKPAPAPQRPVPAPASQAKPEPAPQPAPKPEARSAPRAEAPAEPRPQPKVLATVTTLPTATTIPELGPSPAPSDANDGMAVKSGAPGTVTAHPGLARTKEAIPRSDAAPTKTLGTADGGRNTPAKPLAPLPSPGIGTVAKPQPDVPASGDGGTGSGGSAATPPEDDYAAAAERWRSRMAGGMGGMDGAAGQKGAVGDGTTQSGGGGTVVGFEFLSYRQRIFALIKRNWANAVRSAGLVAAVRFEIGPDGEVSGVQLVRSSGDKTYDQSVVRAVQRSSPLPPPPERYRDEFREVVVDFHSEEEGGQGAG